MTKVIILSTTTECSYNFWSKNIFKSYESQDETEYNILKPVSHLFPSYS